MVEDPSALPPTFPWAGKTVERFEHYLTRDMRKIAADYDYAVFTSSRIGSSLREAHLIFVKEGQRPFFLSGSMSRGTIDLGYDLIEEIYWASAEEYITVVVTYEPATERIIRTSHTGKSARHFQVGPHNIFERAEEVRPS